MLFDDLDRTQWLPKMHETRSAYSALREHFLKYIEHPDDLQSTIDPLADDEEVCFSHNPIRKATHWECVGNNEHARESRPGRHCDATST